jgi:hypothetical protein
MTDTTETPALPALGEGPSDSKQASADSAQGAGLDDGGPSGSRFSIPIAARRALTAFGVLIAMVLVSAATLLLVSAFAPSALPAGPTGVSGIDGPDGMRGARGPRGRTGRAGATGAQGAAGATEACSNDLYGPGRDLPYC